MNLLLVLKMKTLTPNKIKKKETESLLTNMVGTSMMPRRFGASDLKLQEPIS